MTTLSEQEFRVKSDEALEGAEKALLPLADSEGLEIEIQDGVLEIAFDEPKPTKFVVSPNAPARQVWVSAMGRGYKLGWSAGTGMFELNGEALPLLLERLAREFINSK